MSFFQLLPRQIPDLFEDHGNFSSHSWKTTAGLCEQGTKYKLLVATSTGKCENNFLDGSSDF